MRELRWRDVRAWPVKFAATDVFPKNTVRSRCPPSPAGAATTFATSSASARRSTARRSRTLLRSVAHPGAWCNDSGYPCFRNDAQVDLNLSIPPRPGYAVAQARFVHDGRAASGTNARATLRLGGTLIGQLPSPASVPGAESQAWVRAALSLPPAAIIASNNFQLTFDPGFHIDRMEVELGYIANGVPDTLFANGFEPGNKSDATAFRTRAVTTHWLPTLRFGQPAGNASHCGTP